MTIGELTGTAVGAAFENRAELAEAGVHRATQAGITGRAEEGAESIVLSGGYIDDEDLGDIIVYTGHGGRDPNTGRQIADQTFTRQNQALVSSALHGHPVRVIRGSQHKSQFSPPKGYRYDGLYRVDSYWLGQGKDGFKVCKFKLLKLDDKNIPESGHVTDASGGAGALEPTRRMSSQVLRIVRDTALGKQVKAQYDYRCQVCGETLECQGGVYAEAAHIKPLGRPHNGPDHMGNLLCLCPNHHVLFDNGGFAIADDWSLVGISGMLRVNKKHSIDKTHIEYHRRLWFE